MTLLRVQLHRTPGWRKPPNTVVCSRPGRWGNPHTLANYFAPGSEARRLFGQQATSLVAAFERQLLTGELRFSVADVRRELANKNLACWCRLCPKHRNGKPLLEHCQDCAPCHVDPLGRVAAGGEP